MSTKYVRSEASERFEQRWQAIWPEHGLPTSDMLHHVDFKELAPFILKGNFIRPTGERGHGARFEVFAAGDGIASRLNVDVTGFEYFQRLLPNDRALIVDVFEALFEEKCGRWRVMFYNFDKGRKVPVDTTFFPYLCSKTGAEQVGSLIIPAQTLQDCPTIGRAYSAEAGPDAEWLDMGAGVPAKRMLTLSDD